MNATIITHTIVPPGKFVANLCLCLLLVVSMPMATRATNYYSNPSTGSMLNNGSLTAPWGSLQQIFAALKTFVAGDTIFCYGGYHGFPTIKGWRATGTVTIKAVAGSNPQVRKMLFDGASGWMVEGFSISPEYAGLYESGGRFVRVYPNSTRITVKNCLITSAANISGWSGSTVLARFGTGVYIEGTNCTIQGNTIKEINLGIVVNSNATGTLITGNLIDGYAGDGINGLASYCRYEYNTVQKCYSIDSHHDDGFQSWSVDSTGTPGAGTVYNVEIRGNVFNNAVSASQPFVNDAYGCHGIGCFDGFYENWIVENNLIIADYPYTFVFSGAINCTIVNNTLVTNPLNLRPDIPFMSVSNHKTRGASSGNYLRNNLVNSFGTVVGCTHTNNISSTNFTALYQDYTNFDFHLKAGCAAIDAGTLSNAPSIDLDQHSRVAPYDIGCYERETALLLQADTNGAKNEKQALQIRYNGNASITVVHPKAAKAARIDIVSVSGQVVKSLQVQQDQTHTPCNVSNLAGGQYIVVYYTGVSKLSAAFIKP
jgi:hypothetical protein